MTRTGNPRTYELETILDYIESLRPVWLHNKTMSPKTKIKPDKIPDLRNGFRGLGLSRRQVRGGWAGATEARRQMWDLGPAQV